MSKNNFELNFEEKNDALDMAISDFDKFCKYAGINFLQLKVCIEVGKKKSYGQVSAKLKIPKSTIRNISKKCSLND